MNKAEKKAERRAEDKIVRKQAIYSGLTILSMYGGFLAYFS